MAKSRNLTSQKCRDLSPSHHRWQGNKTRKPWDHFPSLSPSFLTFASRKVSIFPLFSSHRVSTSFLQLLDCLCQHPHPHPHQKLAAKSSGSSWQPSILSTRTRSFRFPRVYQHQLRRKRENDNKATDS